MTRTLVRVARTIYKATPVPAVRQLYFSAFCRVMRERRVRATINGSTFDLDLGEMIDVTVYLEQYELDVTSALNRYCKPGMTVLDIGANIGAHTLPLGRLVTTQGAVYAFEPTDFAFEKLTRNVSLNDAPHVHAIKAALSNRNAERQAIAYRSSWRTAGGRNDGDAFVDFIRLDDWCAGNGVKEVGLIKIDIDGNEFEALAGGIQLIERSRPVIVMEAVWPHFADQNRNPFLLLQGAGYRFWDAKSDREFATVHEIARLFPDEDRDMTTSINVIARPRVPEE
jgi:FkbM family methyltransferase